jgi:hypothetical protein
MGERPLKISSHLGRITVAFGDSGYIRSTDNAMIFVRGMRATWMNKDIGLRVEEDELWIDDYFLSELDDNTLVWDSEDGETILWHKVDPKILKEFESHLKVLSSGEIPTNPWIKQEQVKKESHNVDFNRPPILTAASVNEMVIPVLKDADFLIVHLEQIEELAKSLSIISNNQITESLRVPFAMKLHDSLRELPNIQATTRQMLTTMKYDFFAIKSTLTRTFCNRSRLRAAIRKRLDNLKFRSFQDAENFISEASMILAIIGRLYDKEWTVEYCATIHSIIAKLPETLKNRVFSKLADIADGGRWELALPFDEGSKESEFFASHMCEENIADLIRNQSERQLELHELGSTAPHVQKADRVNRVHEESANDFARKFKAAFVAYPNRDMEISAADEKLQAAGFTTRKQLSAKKTTYFVIGSPLDKEKCERLLQDIEGINYRHFVFNHQKNM